MACNENITSRRLLQAFMQFKKIDWHSRTIVGYKPSEIRILFCIKNSALKVSEISHHLHVTSPTVTQSVNKLEDYGLVERCMDTKDKRAVWVHLTPKGTEIVKKAEEMMFSSFQGLITFLGEDDSNQLAELLTKVFQYYLEEERHNDADWDIR